MKLGTGVGGKLDGVAAIRDAAGGDDRQIAGGRSQVDSAQRDRLDCRAGEPTEHRADSRAARP